MSNLRELHCVKIETFTADTDYSGLIYHANYLRYMDYGRTLFLKEKGFSLHALAVAGNHFVVSHLDIRYIKPAKFTSLLAVMSELTQLRAASIVFLQHVCDWQNRDVIYCEAQIKLVFVNQEFKPQRVPKNMVEKLI